MNTAGASPYDTLPYESNAFAQTHPDRTGVIARIFGMTPAPPSRCRVLEIGCASGGNLIAMASQLPESTFVGIDLSARQIEDGKAMLRDLEIGNVELRQMNLSDVDASMGEFDYIVAHGVYSWIPAAAQDSLLSICKHNLAPQGVAYVSYNTYPGWHMRGMVRAMMNYHVRRFSDVRTRVGQARALLDFLAANVATENNPYGMLLKSEVDILRGTGDSYLAHEHLEEVNEPIYFHEFAEKTALRGLQYLGEAEFHTMLASNFPKQVADTLRSLAPDIVQMEQYMDFVRNRLFRQTLLVHQNVVLNRNVTWRNMMPFYVSSQLRPQSAQPDLDSRKPEQFVMPNAMSGISATEPIVKAALVVLWKTFPRTLSMTELARAARELLAGGVAAADEATLAKDVEHVATDMLGCYAAGIADLRSEPAKLQTTVSARPRADRLARYLAARGRLVANRRHEPVILDELTRQVLPHLDGERDHGMLVDIMARIATTDDLQIRKGEQRIRDPKLIRDVLEQMLPESYAKLARVGLLEA
jgi:methyltransferase-like protein/SAM-dependent methyltransferase